MKGHNTLEVRRGSVVVKIYRTTYNQQPAHEIAYYSGGRRRKKVLYKKEDADALAEAGKIANTLNAGNGAVMELTAKDAHDYREALRIIGPTRRPLVAILTEHLEATQILGEMGVSLGEVIRDYASRHSIEQRTIPEAVEEFLAERDQDGVGERHAADLRNRLSLWAADFPGKLTALTGPQIDAWLRDQQDEREWEGLTRNHYRAAILAFTNWAKAKKFLPPAWNEMDAVPVASAKPGAIGVFAPAHARTLLEVAAAHRPELLPYLAIACFSGVRNAEILRMDWADLYWDHQQVFVGRGKVNQLQRAVPMQPNLRSWLWPYRKASGPVCEVADIGHALAELAALAKVEWSHNGPRHSYVSYRLALVQNAAQVAEECGNSPKVIKSRYARPVPTTDATEFFAIEPKIIPKAAAV